MSKEVEKIKSILSVTEILSEYIKLERAGSSFKSRCPFHNEKTPSFYVSPDKGIYKCFGCGKSGDIFSFVEEYEGVDFKDALKKLAGKAGVVLDNYQKKDSSEDILKNKLKEVHSKAAFFWQKELYKNKKALEYLKKRGITKEILISFKIGFAPNEWNKTNDYLKNKGFSEKEILLSGITKKNEKGNIYDRFRNRIIFPIFESSGKIIAFSGRDLSGEDNVAKYLNSPATIIFDKSKELYGFNFAKNNIRKQKYIIITEGQFDIVLSHQNNFLNTVATSGTSLTEEHLKKIKNFTSNIIFAFDSDKAGISSAFRGTKLAIANGFTVKISDIEKGMDPADILSSKNGKQKWIKTISTAKDFIIFFSEKILNSKNSFEEKVKKMEKEILPLVAEIKDSIIVEKYLRNIANGFGVSEKSVILAMEKSFKIKQDEVKKNKKYQETSQKYKKNIVKKVEKENDFLSHFSDYPENLNEENIEENLGNYHDFDSFSEKSIKKENKLENKNKSTIIWNNKKSKILERIAKIYFFLEKQESENSNNLVKTKNKKKEIDKNYIKERYLEFLPKEKFEHFIDENKKKLKIQEWEFEDILIEDNFLKTEVDQLFFDFNEISNKEEIKKLQKELLRFNFLGDNEKIKEIKAQIAKIIIKLK